MRFFSELGGATRQEGTLDLRVASIPVILGAGLLGALSPLFLQAWQDPNHVLQRMTRSFSGGAILALAVIHVMPDAYEALEKAMQEQGQLVGGSTLLLGIFAMVFIEGMANQMLCPSKHSVHVHGCNQYHASRSRQADGKARGSEATQPLLSAAGECNEGAYAPGVDGKLQQLHGEGQGKLVCSGLLDGAWRSSSQSSCGSEAAAGAAQADEDEDGAGGAADGACQLQPPCHIVRMEQPPSSEQLQQQQQLHRHHHHHPAKPWLGHHPALGHQARPHAQHHLHLPQTLHEHPPAHTHLHMPFAGHQGHDEAALVLAHDSEEHSDSSSSSSHRHNVGESIRKKVMAYMLELGCVFHSLFIGLSLGVTIEGRPQVLALIFALAVHQLLEGLALGSVVAAAQFGRSSGVSMAVMYSLTTPLGVGLGVMASNYYGAVSNTGLIVQGLANAASAGMLLYIALVQLVSEHNKYVAAQLASSGAKAAAATPAGPPSALPMGQSSSLELPSSRHQRMCFMPGNILLCHSALVAGAAMMWVMGFWA